MLVRRLAPGDAQAYWETRNRGLQEFPDAFTSSHEEGVATPLSVLAKRFGGSGSDDFVLGAFSSEGTLAGHAGFQREARTKNRHKGTLIGMYVVPEFRGRSVGKLLLDQLIGEVRAIPGMERLSLTVTHSNEAARMLYLRAGFVSFGIEEKALKTGGRYYDKEHMVLAL
ncbi:MAG: GNAT family N-acetyltransferase [Betaproteobacteria bacterium]